MRSLLTLIALALLAAPVVDALTLSEPSAAPGSEDPAFDCPDDAPAQTPADEPCPTRLSDLAHHYGQPSLVVHPVAPERLALAALGGAPATGPTGSTRDGPAVFLFASTDGARTFTRTPVPAPAEGLQAEAVTLATDAKGGLALAALYSKPAGGERSEFVLAAWKLGEFPGTGGLAGSPTVFARWTDEGRFSHVRLAHEPANDTFLLLWQEHGVAPDERSRVGPAPWVRLATTPAAPDAPWSEQATADIIGPCGAPSAPVAHAGRLLMACQAGTGYLERRVVGPGNRTVEPGFVLVHVHDPVANNLTFFTYVLAQGAPSLAVQADGTLTVAAVTVESPEVVRVLLTSASPPHYRWSRGGDVGPFLHTRDDAPLLDARILGFQSVGGTSTVRFLYHETLAPQEVPVEGAPSLAPRARKALVTSYSDGHVIPEDLGVEAPQTRLLRAAAPGGLSPMAPEDFGDSLATFHTREFLAYSDAGTLVVGELPGTLAPTAPDTFVTPSNTITKLTQKPPRALTTQALVTGTALAVAVVAGALVRGTRGGP